MSSVQIEIPGYRMHGRLGKGGMAEVFLATQESLHRKVAIKVLSKSGDAAFNKRFVKEAHTLAALSHPSIITIYDIDELIDGRPYLAMEFLPGGDLAHFRGEVFAPERALKIVRQIASGLAVVHEKGLVHRDVKPANILFRSDDTAVLTDFGVAKELNLDSELTQVGVAVGSPAYSSPEQAQCQSLDARSDIYSLGVILLEMLTGTNPYRSGNYTQTVVNHVQMPMPDLPPSLASFQGLLDRMLAKQPAMRFNDCHELLAALDALELSDLEQTQLRPQVALPVVVDEPTKRVKALPVLMVLALFALSGCLVFAGLYIKEQRHITALLDQAELRFASGQLDGPGQGHADYYFRQVLALDPENTQARAGLERIRQSQMAGLLQQAELRLAAGQWYTPDQDNAQYYFHQVLTIDPANSQAQQGLLRVKQAQIEHNLALAESSFLDQRLLVPENASAVFYLRQVLAIDPENAQALNGLTRVAQQYRELAQAAYRRGDYPNALAMVERGLEVEPSHVELLAMRDDHPRLLAASRAKAQLPRDELPVVREEVMPIAQPEPTSAPESNALKRAWNNIFGR